MPSQALRAARPRTSPAHRRVRRGKSPRIVVWAALLVALLVLVLVFAGVLIDEPMRRSMERRMNASLRGYTVRIAGLHFQPIGAAVTLRDVEIRQTAHPDPPLAVIPKLRASVEWKQLVFLRLVADFRIERPKLYMNLIQLRSEVANEVPMKQRGWQEAVLAIYPLKINLLRVEDADVMYVDTDPKRPLHLTRLNLRASNIRNIHSKRGTYPSAVQANAVVFESGRAAIEGHADFLAEPYMGLEGRFRVSDIPLDYFRPVMAHWNVDVRGGTLSTSGEVEYAPSVKRLNVPELVVKGVRIDYVQKPPAQKETGLLPASAKTGDRKKPAESGWDLELGRFQLTDANLGLVNRVRSPAYRVFVSHTRLDVVGLSNKAAGGTSTAVAEGRFMDSGPATADATFRPREKAGPDFELRVAIEGTDLTTLNDLFRAYGKFDVAAGTFSLFSEIRVREGTVQGYVKPLFQNIEVYDSAQDSGKPLLKKAYEGVLDAVTKILRNRRKAVATTVDLSGPIENPKSSILQIIGKLIENAFFKAILPGFDRQIGIGAKK